MLKKYSMMLIILLIVPVMLNAQNQKIEKLAPKVYLEPQKVQSIGGIQHLPPSGWTTIDTMGNAYGPAESNITPLCYDPYSNALVFAHRGSSVYGSGGVIYYNMSTNAGSSWARITGINSASTNKAGRYPSMTIQNQTKGDLSATTGIFAYPLLTVPSGGFGWMGYGADQPLGAAAPFSVDFQPTPPDSFSSRVSVWSSDQTNSIFWLAQRINAAGPLLFKTQDFQTVTTSVPWLDAEFKDNGVETSPSISFKGVQYVAGAGSFVPPDTNNPFLSGWSPGLSKSTDDGARWSSWQVVDFRALTNTSKYDRLYDYKKGDTYIAYQVDLGVDKNEMAHIICTVTDTTGGGDGNNGTNAVVELYETAHGVWDSKVIYEGIPNNAYTTLGLGQMGPSTYIAMDSSRQVMVVSWIAPLPGTPDTDSAKCQIWESHRVLTESTWSTPVNVSNAPTQSFEIYHMARMLKKVDATHYNAFYAYAYPFAGADLATSTGVYGYTHTIMVNGVNENKNVVDNYNLSQNYPNPFNPTTTIKFNLAERSNVTLKVFDVLGREVATLFNGIQDKGAHQVNFDASKLSSGMYIYTLKAGNFTQSRKMMLMK